MLAVTHRSFLIVKLANKAARQVQHRVGVTSWVQLRRGEARRRKPITAQAGSIMRGMGSVCQ